MRKTLATLLAAGALALTACGSNETNTAAGNEDQAAETCISHFSSLDNVTDYMGWSDGPQVQTDEDEAEVSGVAYFTTKTGGPGLYDVECNVSFSDGDPSVFSGESTRKEYESDRTSTSKTTPSATTSMPAPPWGELEGTLLDQMQERGIPTGSITNASAVTTAEAACEAMDSGVSQRALLDLVVEEMPMWDTADSILYLELSFSNLCPEHATI